MSVAGILAGARVAAEALMLDACTVVRRGAPSTNASTGAVTVSSMTVYSGKCKVQASGTSARVVEAAGRTATVEPLEVHVPVGAFAPRPGDVVTVTASEYDPALVGRVYRVTAANLKSAASAYRLPVEEVTA